MESADDDGRRQESNMNDQHEQLARARQQARQQHQQDMEQHYEDIRQLEQQLGLEDVRQPPVIPQEEPQLLQLIDEEEWFNIYGLRAGVGNNNNDNNTDDDEPGHRGPRQREIRNRVKSEQAYQNYIHTKIFNEEDRGGNKQNNYGSRNNNCCTNSKQRRRQQQLDEWEHDSIDIVTMSSSTTTTTTTTKSVPVVFRTNLKQLASHSDTVFTMASNKHLYNNTNTNNTINSNNDRNKSSSSSNDRLSLSLCDYTTESVNIFLRVLFLSSSLFEDKNNVVADMNIPPDYVIDCCRLAHYLQCGQLLDRIVDEYLLTSIDNDNCRFLCKLSDQLSLPNLWEASVNHMLSSLDTLLAEQHQYYKERLQDAKDSYTVRLNEEKKLIQELDSLQEERKSNWFGGGYSNIRLDRKIACLEDRLKGLVKGKEYVKPKIDRQIRKVDTLKTLLEEQKKIFGGGREENNQ
ncbi:hypothetical protein FRACYDRAFT_233288 [Fragilariopsis cylindrus CCMP1102]|uniref:BTB domain-containing protein n=1 Tax=Fragilariopsis cylindrus CCMP1102 TaxID=635003 RepID=A0A1E7FY96_9STRA|nr:hypothetical protein FRACYDRAFT_233288 [Fragilariopsis cylindrus CCMP1102]|eukprot:OEU23121.1 hypothetical protein FRACYDRAFT_233288 [Fragilariopsis cylindrus CCMP1102]